MARRYEKPKRVMRCAACQGTGVKPGSLNAIAEARSSDDAATVLMHATCQACRGSGIVVEENKP